MLESVYVTNLASSLTFMRELNGSNRSEMIDEMVRRAGLDPATRSPWCACFVAWCGYAVYRKVWPMKRVAGCVSLHDDAISKGMIRSIPSPGDIFLIYGKGHDGVMRFKHTGFVVSMAEEDGLWNTVEGNTNDAGSAEGDGAFERKRTWGAKDRFIHWQGDAIASPVVTTGPSTPPSQFDFWGWLSGRIG